MQKHQALTEKPTGRLCNRAGGEMQRPACIDAAQVLQNVATGQTTNAQQARCGLSHKQSPWPGTSAQSTIPAACAAAAKEASRLAAESNACDSALRGGRHVSADHVEPSQRARLKRLKLQHRSRGDGWTRSVGLARTQQTPDAGRSAAWHSHIDGGNARVRAHRPHCVGRAVMQVSSSYDQHRRARGMQGPRASKSPSLAVLGTWWVLPAAMGDEVRAAAARSPQTLLLTHPHSLSSAGAR